MAYLAATKYVQIAINYAEANALENSTIQYYLNALNQIVNVTASGDSYDANTNQGATVELGLLVPFNSAYQIVNAGLSSNQAVLNAIRSVNNHIINNYTQGSLTANNLLAYYVNSECTWTDGCVPYNWASLCDDLGYQSFELWNDICSA